MALVAASTHARAGTSAPGGDDSTPAVACGKPRAPASLVCSGAGATAGAGADVTPTHAVRRAAGGSNASDDDVSLGAVTPPAHGSEAAVAAPAPKTVPIPDDIEATHRSKLSCFEVPYFIAPSLVSDGAGAGVFAVEPIPKGTLVYRYNPDCFVHLTEHGWKDELTEFLVKRGDVTAESSAEEVHKAIGDLIGEDHILSMPWGEVVMELGDGQYLNHSRSPNLIQDAGSSDERTQRDVAAGEELTSNYFGPPNGGYNVFPQWWTDALEQFGQLDNVVHPAWA